MNPSPVSASPTRKKSRLLLWVVLAFVIQAAAWTAWFTIAAHNKVTEIPLTTNNSP
jgi:hypothetical protein